jgi:hypothetical protein
MPIAKRRQKRPETIILASRDGDITRNSIVLCVLRVRIGWGDECEGVNHPRDLLGTRAPSPAMSAKREKVESKKLRA